MSQYTAHTVQLSDNQKAKLHRAVKSGSTVSLKLSHAQLTGRDPLPLTQTQINHIQKSHNAGVGYVLKLSEPQVRNIVTGGFLPLLLGALGALATGALSGAASYGATKLLKNVAGDGFGEAYIQNTAAIGKGVPKKKTSPPKKRMPPKKKVMGGYVGSPLLGRGVSQGFQGQGLFQYGQPAVRSGMGMVPLYN